MLVLREEYLKHLESLHAEIERVLEGLPQEALDWSPGAETNSLAVLAAHAAGSERYWVGEVVGGDPAHRDRPAEFQTRGVSLATLKERLDAALLHSRGILQQLDWSNLGEECFSHQHDRHYTVAWALLHVLEHEAIHLGHMQLTRQIWEQRG